jgi:hypothetical protein
MSAGKEHDMQQLALNRTVTTGVALVGASAIALTPIVTIPPNIQLPSIRGAETELAAFVNPIQEWVEVVGTSFANLSALGTQFQADPLPILGQLLQNQMANVTALFDAGEQTLGLAVSTFASLPQTLFTAAQQVAQGQVADAVQTLLSNVVLPFAVILVSPVTAVLPIAQKAVQNFANVIQAASDGLLTNGIAVIAPIFATSPNSVTRPRRSWTPPGSATS